MPKVHQEFFLKYSYLSTASDKYVFSVDDARFVNHSQKRFNLVNTDCSNVELCSVASRDIEAGEELLEDYRTFDAKDAVSNEEYLNS
jgi:SET domain-containing protein